MWRWIIVRIIVWYSIVLRFRCLPRCTGQCAQRCHEIRMCSWRYTEGSTRCLWRVSIFPTSAALIALLVRHEPVQFTAHVSGRTSHVLVGSAGAQRNVQASATVNSSKELVTDIFEQRKSGLSSCVKVEAFFCSTFHRESSNREAAPDIYLRSDITDEILEISCPNKKPRPKAIT